MCLHSRVALQGWRALRPVVQVSGQGCTSHTACASVYARTHTYTHNAHVQASLEHLHITQNAGVSMPCPPTAGSTVVLRMGNAASEPQGAHPLCASQGEYCSHLSPTNMPYAPPSPTCAYCSHLSPTNMPYAPPSPTCAYCSHLSPTNMPYAPTLTNVCLLFTPLSHQHALCSTLTSLWCVSSTQPCRHSFRAP